MATKNLRRTWFGVMVVFAFASIISFFQINSYQADKHHMNGLFGWLGIGIVLAIIACFCLYKVWNYGGSSNDSTGYKQ